MRRATLPASILLLGVAACGSPAPGDDAPHGVHLQSDSITLPEDGETFAATGGDAILDRNCLACHSVAMIRYQPPLKEAQWKATVEKMRDAYGAPIADADIPAIVAALEKLH